MTTGIEVNNDYYDVLIIGSGISGLSASLFCTQENLKAIQVGSVGGIQFSAGLIDLMAVHPLKDLKLWENPWEAIDEVRKDIPQHPYCKVSNDEIKTALTTCFDYFKSNGMEYIFDENKNSTVVTAMGTIKHSYGIPKTMTAANDAWESKSPALIVDFKGLKEFSSIQVVESLKDEWPGLSSTQITFPETENKEEIFATHMAQWLELPSNVTKLSNAIKPHLGSNKAVGLPAILGVLNTESIHNQLENELGVKVFEIPTMPTSVPGFRLKNVFDRSLTDLGLTRLNQKFVTNVEFDGDHFNITTDKGNKTIKAKTILLATGRFMGKGLIADINKIREPLFDLPVTQPDHRSKWHNEDFVAPEGHPINQAGIEVDKNFQPIKLDGTIVYKNLFAAGAILAHQDWIRMKCGSGLAIATAYKAVHSIKKYLQQSE